MNFLSANVLGLAIGDRSIALAEMSASRSQATVARTATFTFPADTSIEKPAALGEALAAFLRENGFTARRAIFGLPAKWLIAMEKRLPPSSPDMAADILRIQAERQFPSDSRELALDFTIQTDPTTPQTVLLLATAQQHVDNITQLAMAAGLNQLAITSSTLALSAALKLNDRAGMLLTLGADSAELAVYAANGPRSLRHLAVTGNQLISSNGTAAAGLATLGSELLRAGSLGDHSARGDLLVWDSIGLDPAAVTALGQRSGMAVHTARDLSRLNVTTTAPSENIPGYGAAVALATVGVQRTLPVDFVHSRLAPKKPPRFGPKVTYGAIGAAVVLCLFILPALYLHQIQSQLDRANAELAQKDPYIKEAEVMVNKSRFADGWFEQRTPVMECLRRITLAFPQEPTIWATSYSLHDNNKGFLAGKAPSRREPLAVYDNLRRDKHFTDVTPPDMHEATGSNREVSFSISFTFNPAGAP